jgi:non-ribosomal peptide synthetase component F
LGEVQLSNEIFAHTTSKFDLTFAMVETEAGLHGSIEYCTDLFNSETINRMAVHFEELMKAIVKAPQLGVDSLSILLPSERQAVTHRFQ